MQKIQLRFYLYILSFIFVSFLLVVYTFAWQEPTQPPPSENAYSPLNIGTNLQIKTGPLQFPSYYGLDNTYFINPSGTISALFKGKVGIRNLNPNYPLDVFGDINISNGLLRINGNEGSPGQVLTRTSSGITWQNPSSGGSSLWTTTNNGLNIYNTNQGNVGIGTINPVRKLEVNSTDSWSARFTTLSGYIDFGPANTSGAHIYTNNPRFFFNKDIVLVGNPSVLSAYSTNNLVLSTNSGSSPRITILANNGNVGIGLTNPQYKLDINGDINLPSTAFLRIAGNSGEAGQVLTRTSNGMAWQNPGGGQQLPNCSSEGEYLKWDGSRWVCSGSGNIIPPGSKFVFITSTIYRGGNIGGLSGADQKCKQVADSSNLEFLHGRVWKAALGDNTAYATRACSSNVNYYYPTGRRITHEGCIPFLPHINENGGGVSGYKWYGRSSSSNVSHCNNWSSNIGNGRAVRPNEIMDFPCTYSLPLICFEQ